MTEEIPLELIPELTQSERQSATKITFNNTNGETDIDFIGLVDGFRSIAPTNAYKFVALEGETYSFLSVSFFRLSSESTAQMEPRWRQNPTKWTSFTDQSSMTKSHQSQTMNTTTFTNGKHHKQELSL